MKILLINPPLKEKYVREGRCNQKSSSFSYLLPPLSLMYIASMLKNEDFHVQSIDFIGENKKISDLESILNNNHFDIGIVNCGHVTFKNDIESVQLLKKQKIITIGIGIIFSLFPENFKNYPELDYAIYSEPEIAIKQLCKFIRRKKYNPTNKNVLISIPNLLFKSRNGNTIMNKNKFINNLDEIPFPDSSFYKKTDYYFPLGGKNFVIILPARGCSFNCPYCISSINL